MKSLLSFIKPNCCLLLAIHNSVSVKLLVILRLEFAQAREDKFRRNFLDTLSLYALAVLSLRRFNTIFCAATFSLPFFPLL